MRHFFFDGTEYHKCKCHSIKTNVLETWGRIMIKGEEIIEKHFQEHFFNQLIIILSLIQSTLVNIFHFNIQKTIFFIYFSIISANCISYNCTAEYDDDLYPLLTVLKEVSDFKTENIMETCLLDKKPNVELF